MSDRTHVGMTDCSWIPWFCFCYRLLPQPAFLCVHFCDCSTYAVSPFRPVGLKCPKTVTRVGLSFVGTSSRVTVWFVVSEASLSRELSYSVDRQPLKDSFSEVKDSVTISCKERVCRPRTTSGPIVHSPFSRRTFGPPSRGRTLCGVNSSERE